VPLRCELRPVVAVGDQLCQVTGKRREILEALRPLTCPEARVLATLLLLDLSYLCEEGGYPFPLVLSLWGSSFGLISPGESLPELDL
jgi:hypothetical protein